MATMRFGAEALAEPRLTRGRFNMQLWEELVGLSVDHGRFLVLQAAATAECLHRPRQLALLQAVFEADAIREVNMSMVQRGRQIVEVSNRLLLDGTDRPWTGGTKGLQQAKEPGDLPPLEAVLREMAETASGLMEQQSKEQKEGAPAEVQPLRSAIDDSFCLVAVVAFAMCRSCDILRQFEVRCYAAEHADN